MIKKISNGKVSNNPPRGRIRIRKKGKKTNGNIECNSAVEDEYKVGYGQPPKHTQYKPGKSGNPKGKPKGRPKKRNTRDFLSVFASDLQVEITVQFGGREQKITKLEALASSLNNTAIKGNMQAAKLVVSLIQILAQGQGGQIPLSPEQEDLLRGLLENE